MNQNIDIQAVLVEVGRLHLYVLTLEQQLREANDKIVKLTPKSPAPPTADVAA